MSLTEYLKASGFESVSDEISKLATIVKEGVNSYDMLMYKQKNGYMRVHTHLKFHK